MADNHLSFNHASYVDIFGIDDGIRVCVSTTIHFFHTRRTPGANDLYCVCTYPYLPLQDMWK